MCTWRQRRCRSLWDAELDRLCQGPSAVITKAALALVEDGFGHAEGECLVNNSNSNTNNTNTVAIVIGTVIVVLLLFLVFGGGRMMTGGMMNW